MDYRLKKGEVITVQTAAAHCLRVDGGCLWLTRPGDGRDYLMGRGDRFDVEAGETLVLEALADATFSMECMGLSDMTMTIMFQPCRCQSV